MKVKIRRQWNDWRIAEVDRYCGGTTASICAIRPLPMNSFFILSIRAMAKSILGPVTMHICELANQLSFMQSHAMNRSINSDMPKPVAFFIQTCLLALSLPF
jgi:hypothetical protein